MNSCGARLAVPINGEPMEINVVAEKSFVRRYKELLGQEWSYVTLEESVALLDAILRRAGLQVVFTLKPTERPKPSEYPIPATARETLREYLEGLNAEEVERAAAQDEELSRRRAKDRHLAELTWKCVHYLTLPNSLSVSDPGGPSTLVGEVGFFNDVRSVLFQTSVLELLPVLRTPEWAHLRSILTNALAFHATIFWTGNPAHQHYLRSVLFEGLGDTERASAELQHSFRATKPEDPDYFVKAYSFWSSLVDRDELENAKGFALGLLRACPPELAEDARALVDDSYRLLETTSRPMRPKQRPR